jgi:hypothetical protein
VPFSADGLLAFDARFSAAFIGDSGALSDMLKAEAGMYWSFFR